MKLNLFLVIFIILPFALKAQEGQQARPNIIVLYVDDLGYGDVGCYGATGVQTPNIDKLASEGRKFTDAHSSASTCTPSRFALLTGIYAFRNKAAILPGDAPLLIPPGKPTLPRMLQQRGYRTAVVGKWHLGLGNGSIDWNGHIQPGPNEIGFDYSFLLPATGDRVPTVYVENGRVVSADSLDPINVSYKEKTGSEPTGLSHPELLRLKADTQHSQTIVNGVSRIGYMSGGKKARWVDEDFADIFTGKAKEFINASDKRPFFLHYCFQDIHVPRLPHPRFKGKSTMGPRGDAIAQVDWVVGEMIRALREKGLEKNTLIIFSSDNGPVLDDGYDDHAEELVGSHRPAGPYRGGKYSIFEGGTRMPMIAWWPGTIAPSVTDALFCQVDLMASLAGLTGEKLPDPDLFDSEDFGKLLTGQSKKGREELIEEGFVLSLRQGQWKYIEPGTIAPDWLRNKKIGSGLSTEEQLYDLSHDIAEQHNLALKYPHRARKMKKRLDELRAKPIHK